LKEIQYGLGPQGKLLALAPVGNVDFNTAFLIRKGASVHGWSSGHALDSEESIEFAKNHGVKCLVEKFRLDDAPKAFEAMLAGKLRFRGVLVME
jgi:D-arabinose 1-dehydrogenase-like Zn-dependent alcohol dehydrogenase